MKPDLYKCDIGAIVEYRSSKPVAEEKFDSIEEMFSKERILEAIPRGMNMLSVACGNCGFTGLIHRQITDGGEPYCSECGKQELQIDREVSMVNTDSIFDF